jgi:anaerobic selenocysteine-containing dehydrogenase
MLPVVVLVAMLNVWRSGLLVATVCQLAAGALILILQVFCDLTSHTLHTTRWAARTSSFTCSFGCSCGCVQDCAVVLLCDAVQADTLREMLERIMDDFRQPNSAAVVQVTANNAA